jgi:Zn-dependent alcohol dehydrogenase
VHHRSGLRQILGLVLIRLDDANDAFEAMERQDGIRTVITY